jgi:DNA repair protein RadC
LSADVPLATAACLRRDEELQGGNYPREGVREALACGAEQILCVRSDPAGDHQPRAYDAEDARRVKRALDLLVIPLLDYVIFGESVTSLRQRGVI